MVFPPPDIYLSYRETISKPSALCREWLSCSAKHLLAMNSDALQAD